ncbi:MAG: hypothetical protein MR009_01370 [Sutterellaceae bacterium]|nr:hypothetical protein [Sutterellaceae bacterium]MDY2869183.1 hypothetical protein [Mesosutterella sp.]
MQEPKAPGRIPDVAVMVLTERELEVLRTWGAAYRSFVADYFRQLPGPESRGLMERIVGELRKINPDKEEE